MCDVGHAHEPRVSASSHLPEGSDCRRNGVLTLLLVMVKTLGKLCRLLCRTYRPIAMPLNLKLGRGKGHWRYSFRWRRGKAIPALSNLRRKPKYVSQYEHPMNVSDSGSRPTRKLCSGSLEERITHSGDAETVEVIH